MDMKKKKRIIIIIQAIMLLLPVCSFGQTPFSGNDLPSSQSQTLPKQAPFDNPSPLRGPGGDPGGSEEIDTGGGVGFGTPVSDVCWLVCLMAAGYGVYRKNRKKDVRIKN